MTIRQALLSGLLLAALLPAMAQNAQAAEDALGTPRFIGCADLPTSLAAVRNLKVGGISGIDYVPQGDVWYLVSDSTDPGLSRDRLPARFFVGQILFRNGLLFRVRLTGANMLMTPLEKSYRPGAVVPRSIRLDTVNRWLLWTSEGDRPFIKRSRLNGREDLSITPPKAIADPGTRFGQTLEGLTLAADGQSMWVSMEGPLEGDGRPATAEAGALVRFTQLDQMGGVLSQVAYPIDPIPTAKGETGISNGVSEILTVSPGRMLVVERAVVEWMTERRHKIRLYLADLAGATDIKEMGTLAGVQPMTKQLLLDLDGRPEIGHVGNIEGVSFGPSLPSGNRTLVLAANDGFSRTQANQIIAFELMKDGTVPPAGQQPAQCVTPPSR